MSFTRTKTGSLKKTPQLSAIRAESSASRRSASVSSREEIRSYSPHSPMSPSSRQFRTHSKTFLPRHSESPSSRSSTPTREESVEVSQLKMENSRMKKEVEHLLAELAVVRRVAHYRSSLSRDGHKSGSTEEELKFTSPSQRHIRWIEEDGSESVSMCGGMKTVLGVLPSKEVIQAHIFPMPPVSLDDDEEEECISRTENMMRRILLEMESLSCLQCQNLLRYIGIAYKHPRNGHDNDSSFGLSMGESNMFAVLTSHDPEFMPLTASDLVVFQNWSWLQVVHLIHQVVDGLQMLQEMNIGYKLFSPQSILYHPVDLGVLLSQYGEWATFVRPTFSGSSWSFPHHPSSNDSHAMAIGMMLALFIELKCPGSFSCFEGGITWSSFKHWWDEMCSSADAKLPSIDQDGLSSIPFPVQSLYQEACSEDKITSTFLKRMQIVLDDIGRKIFPWDLPTEVRYSPKQNRIGRTGWNFISSDCHDGPFKFISQRIEDMDDHNLSSERELQLPSTDWKIMFSDKKNISNVRHRIMGAWKDGLFVSHDQGQIEVFDESSEIKLKLESTSNSSIGPPILSVGVLAKVEEIMQLALEPAAWLHSHSLSTLSCRSDILSLVEDTFFEKDEDEDEEQGFPFAIMIFWVLLMDLVPKEKESSAAIRLNVMERSKDLSSEESKIAFSLSHVENLIPACVVEKRKKKQT